MSQRTQMRQWRFWATAMLVGGLLTGAAQAQVVFTDSFDRSGPQIDDINTGLPTGQSGTIAVPVSWVETSDIITGLNGLVNVENNRLHVADGPNMGVTYLDRNWTDAAFTNAGGMTISLDIVSNDGTADDVQRYVGFGVGATQTEAANAALDFAASAASPGWRGDTADTDDGFADFCVTWTPNGGPSGNSNDQEGTIQVFSNGALLEVLDNGGLGYVTGGTLSAAMAFNSFAAGTTVTVQVQYNGLTQQSYQFNWDNTGANYIGITSRQNGAGYTVDNFTIEAGTVTPELAEWTGDGADSNWGTADNWLEDVTPDFPGGAAKLFFPLSDNASPNNEATGRTIDDLTFLVDAQAYTFTGEDFSVTGTVVNGSSNLQTFNNGVIASGGGTGIFASTADMTMASVDAAAAVRLAASGAATLTVNSLMGVNDVEIDGSGVVSLPNANSSFTGNITLPREDDCVLAISNADALGDTGGNTFLGSGATHWLEISGGITVAEPLVAQPKGADAIDQATIVSASGGNVLDSTISVIGDTVDESRTSIQFNVFDGTLTVTNPISWDIDGTDTDDGDPITNQLALVGRSDNDTNSGTLIIPWNVIDDTGGAADPNLDAVSVEALEGIVMQLNGASNTYSGATTVGGTATLDVNGAIPNTTPITLNGDSTTIDATTIGGLTLSSGQDLAGGGIVLGGVTASSGSSLSPGVNILNIDGGLTLNAGSSLNIDIGETSDLVEVDNGQITGGGPITINVSPAVPVVSGTYTIATAASGITLSDGDFTVVEDDPASLIDSVLLSVTATEVQLTITTSAAITEVLARTDDGLLLFKVQNGVWSSPTVWVASPATSGIESLFHQWDAANQELVVFEDRSENDANPARVLRLDRSGWIAEVLGTQGVTPGFDGTPFFAALAPNGDLAFTTVPTSADNPTPSHVVAYRSGTGVFEEVASNADLSLNASTTPALDLRGVTVTADNRMFVNDRNNDAQGIMEFDFLDGTFTGVFDGGLVDAQGIQWDPIGDRLLVGTEVPSADTVNEYANTGTQLATIFTPPPFPVYLNGFEEPTINMGIHNYITIDGRLYAARFQQGDIVEFNPGGVFDTSRIVASGLSDVSVLQVVDVVECGRYDFDLDDDVDGADVDRFLACLAGPGNPQPAGCTDIEFAKSDADDDGDVDAADAVLFGRSYVGCGQ